MIKMKKIILCVDDEIILLRSLKDEIISVFGHEFEIVIEENPFEALKLVKKFNDEDRKLPIVIADHIMPGMKGDRLLEEIHKISPLTVNIMLSGQVSAEGVINSINNAQLFKYLEKPWNKENLKEIILEALTIYDNSKDLNAENVERRKKIDVLREELDSMGKTMVNYSKL
jgi:DNA-binding NtrC family response regulator